MKYKLTEKDNDKIEYCKNITEQGITPISESLINALTNKEYLKNISTLLNKYINSEKKLEKLPMPDMRLYCICENYFKSIEELILYCKRSNISLKNLNVMDYYRNLAGQNDVVRISNSKSSVLYTAIDCNGYGIYFKSNWKYTNGSIRKMYKPFKEMGVVLENDIYEKSDNSSHILKYYKGSSLLNVGKKINRTI
jgi:hypothetical protein